MFDDNSLIHMLRNMQFKWIGGQDLGAKGYTIKVVFPSPSCDIVYGDSFFSLILLWQTLPHCAYWWTDSSYLYSREIMLFKLLSMGMPDSRQILYFLTYVVVSGFPQSFNLFISTQIIKYFGHRLRLWPHTLGGICYRSKYLLISSEGKTNMEEVQRPKLNLFLPG